MEVGKGLLGGGIAVATSLVIYLMTSSSHDAQREVKDANMEVQQARFDSDFDDATGRKDRSVENQAAVVAAQKRLIAAKVGATQRQAEKDATSDELARGARAEIKLDSEGKTDIQAALDKLK